MSLEKEVLTGKVRIIAETDPASKKMREFGKNTRQVENAQKRMVKTINRANQQRKDMVDSIKRSNASAETQRRLIQQVHNAYGQLKNSSANVAKNNLKGAKAQAKFNERLDDAKKLLEEEKEALRKSAEAQKEREKRQKEAANAIIEGADEESRRLKKQAKEQERIAREEAKRQKKQIKLQEEENKKNQKAANILSKANKERIEAIKSITQSNASIEEQKRLINRINKGFNVLSENQRNAAENTLRGAKAQRGFSNAIRQSKDALKQLNSTQDKSSDKGEGLLSVSRGLKQNFSKLINRFRGAAVTLGTLGATITQVASQLDSLGAIAAGVLVNIQFDQARQRLNSFKDSAQATTEQLNRFNDIATQAGVKTTAVATGMAKFSTAAREAGLNTQQTNSVIRGFAQAQSDLGARSDEVNKNLEKLAELAKQGSITMEDLKEQVSFTNNPLETLANAFGRSEREIRKMIERGKELRTSALIPLAQQLKEQSDASDGLAASFNRLFNTVTKLFRKFNQSGPIEAITTQLQNLRSFLQTPAGAKLLLGLRDAAVQLINETIPNFVQSVKENWGTIKTVSKSVFGFLIGSSVGGAPGGLIGALIGGLGGGAEAFGWLKTAAKNAANNLKPLAASVGAIIAVSFGSTIINSWVPAIQSFVTTTRIAVGATRALRIAMLGLAGLGIGGIILSIAGAFSIFSSNANDAAKSTRDVEDRLKDLAGTADKSLNSKLNETIEKASEKQDRLQKKIRKTKKELEAAKSNDLSDIRPRNRPSPNPSTPDNLKETKTQLENRLKRLRQEHKEVKKSIELGKKARQQRKELLEQTKNLDNANKEAGESLNDLFKTGDPFAEQIKSIDRFAEKINELRGENKRLQTELSGGEVRSDRFRQIADKLKGLSRTSRVDAAQKIGLLGENLTPQAIGKTTDVLGLLTKELEKLLDKNKELKAQKALNEEIAQMKRAEKAYANGRKALARYEAQKKAASITGKKFSEVTQEEISKFREQKEALQDVKREYKRVKTASEQTAQAFTNAMSDFITSTKESEEAIDQLGKTLRDRILQILTVQGVGKPLENSSQGFLQGIFRSIFTSGSGGGTGGVAGNVPKGNAKGGIVNRTSAMMTTDGPQTMSEGNKPEAILPLERQNGVMGVKATGGGGSQPIINIINESGEEPEVTQRQGSNGQSITDIVIPAVKEGVQSGKLDKTMTSRFQGIKPRNS